MACPSDWAWHDHYELDHVAVYYEQGRAADDAEVFAVTYLDNFIRSAPMAGHQGEWCVALVVI